MQQAREVLLRLNALKNVKGVKRGEIPVFPVRKVTPRHVRAMVERLLGEVRTLRPLYGVTEPPPEAPLVTGKVPTDVYRNLRVIGAMLESLGAPPHAPKDVYRLALTLLGELDIVAMAMERQCPAGTGKAVPEKTPADVYALMNEVLGDVHDLAVALNVDAYAPVQAPQRKSGAIRHADVLDLMNTILADVGAIKAALAATRPTVIAAEPPPKRPADVYSAIESAGGVVRCLL